YAVGVAEKAAVGLQTGSGELAAVRWLDAEHATMAHVLAWATEHDLDTAVRLVAALGWWWALRGRLAGQRPLLLELARRAEAGSDGWCAVQFWLGWTAFNSADPPGVLERATAVIDVLGDREPSRVLADCLASQSWSLTYLGRAPEAVSCGRRALAMACELGYPLGQWLATAVLIIAALSAADPEDAVRLARQAGQIPDMPGIAARAR